MNYRWTIEELNEMDDITFAIAILSERKSTLNPNAPLAKKISQAQATLESIKYDMRKYGMS